MFYRFPPISISTYYLSDEWHVFSFVECLDFYLVIFEWFDGQVLYFMFLILSFPVFCDEDDVTCSWNIWNEMSWV